MKAINRISDLIKKYPNDQELGEYMRANVRDSNTLTFQTYQEFVKSMKVYPEKHSIVYPTLGLAGEAGEVAEKVKKWLRGDRELDKGLVAKELGDILWYVTSAADDLGYTLEEIFIMNIEKLQSRKERGVVKGSGDTR